MTWPNVAISTANVDDGSDRPSQARAQIKQTIDAVNSMIDNGPSRGFVELVTTGLKSYQNTTPPETRYRSNVSIAYQTGGNVVTKITDNGEFEIPPGTYMYSFPATDQFAVGTFRITSNTGIGSQQLTSVADGTVRIGNPMTTIFTTNTAISANINSTMVPVFLCV